jgi:hypothetical protein
VKRYRVVLFDFDSRALTLSTEIQPYWEPRVQELWRENKRKVTEGLIVQFGAHASNEKIANFSDLGPKPFSILAFHNVFATEIRDAFVVGGYYPSLTGACALGERILNHLILLLRDDFRHTEEYRRVYRNSSFDKWEVPIATLEAWDVLLPDAAAAFRELATVRNRAIHFHPETDRNARSLALDAIRLLDRAVLAQFPVMGLQPWFIPDIAGESYIKRDWEDHPFIRRVYLPNCLRVGPHHAVVSIVPEYRIRDRDDYPDVEVSDDEFKRLLHQPK